MDNMSIYSQLRNTPPEARKPIESGRLKGFTDVNPAWRIKRLTEVFGACGFGWKYEIADMNINDGANGEKKAFVTINLYVKQGDEWSAPIPGLGGSSFVAKEKNGMHTSDECFKMALSDAIGTACKALGMSHDIFFEKDRTKYSSYDVHNETDSVHNAVDTLKAMGTAKDAAAFIMPGGQYAGLTIGDIYKIDRKYVIGLLDAPGIDSATKNAVYTVLNAARAAAEARKQNAG